MTTHQTVVADLAVGDELLTLGDITYPAQVGPAAPVVVTDLAASTLTGHTLIRTTHGPIHAPDAAPATITTPGHVTSRSILLISRRADLHTRLATLAAPLVRRSPVATDTTAARVTTHDYAVAALVLIDATLSTATLDAMFTTCGLRRRAATAFLTDDVTQTPHALTKAERYAASAVYAYPDDVATITTLSRNLALAATHS